MIAAINLRKIPPAFLEDLQARANELVNTVNCPRPSDEDDDEKSKQDKKQDEEEPPPEDELVPTEPLPPVTEGDE